MKTTSISSLLFILLVIFSCSWPASAYKHEHFLDCLVKKVENYTSISNVVYTPRNSSFMSVLQSPVKNLRLEPKPATEPQVIITPEHESHIPPVVLCARKSRMQIRTRSGGHDYEGLSYIARGPFVLIDLINLSEVTVDAEKKTAWIEAGATLGSLYYRIAEKSPTLGFPAGVYPSVGVGGHFSGGGYGILTRKCGLAADHIIDARIVDVNGKILDRKAMGEDLFWAIRGGGGASFGVIVAWKVQLVDVPKRVTAFIISRTLEQNATQIIHRWQHVAPKIDKELFLSIFIARANSTVEGGRNVTISASFLAVYLGGTDQLLELMQNSFPELGLVREDCNEMSWIQSILYMNFLPIDSGDALLNRIESNMRYNKAKSDYVQQPIPQHGFEGIWRLFFEREGEQALLVLLPYGGRMDEISESALPFPHRSGNLYLMQQLVYWDERNAQHSDRYISWIRRLYSYVTPYVTKNPRAAYLNYRDLDIGQNNINGKTSYTRASIWGLKYFGNNFNRLVRVKTMVDPSNFFKNEQSIPSLV